MTDPGAVARLRHLLATMATATATLPPGARLFAAGWATVELDRAAAELVAELNLRPDAFVDAEGSTFLGARCRVAADGLGGGVSLAILEPATEGRLAAVLARSGEGPVCAWFAIERSGASTAQIGPSEPISPAEPGPFGRERLVLDGPGLGPFRIVIVPPGTIGQ